MEQNHHQQELIAIRIEVEDEIDKTDEHLYEPLKAPTQTYYIMG